MTTTAPNPAPNPEATPKTKALCVATRCTSVEQFIATFHRFCDETSFFVATLTTRPIGLETAFSVQLEDRTPVLRGLCVVIEAWSTPANRFGRPGVRLGVRRLTSESLVVFQQLQAARVAAEAAQAAEAAEPPRPAAQPPPVPQATRPRPGAIPPIPRVVPVVVPAIPGPTSSQIVADVPALADGTTSPPPRAVRAEGTPLPSRVLRPISEPVDADDDPAVITSSPPGEAAPEEPVPEVIAAADDHTTPVATESRAPGSSLVLPANPLMNLSDSSLEGFVDCALYEETGNFFRAPGYEDSLVDIDEIAPPPLRPQPAIRSHEETRPPLSPLAFVPPPEPTFAPEATPLPQLAPPSPATIPPPMMPMAMSYPTATTPPTYGVPAHDHSTAAMLAMAAPDRRRWQLIAGAAVAFSMLLLVIVLATRGGNDRADASTGAAPPRAAAAAPAQPAPTAVAPAPTPAVAPEPDTTAPAPSERPAAPTPRAPEPAGESAVPVLGPDEVADALADTNAAPLVGDGPCKLTVTSTPAGSIVRVDDRTVGPSPITIAGPCTRRKVDVRHPRYAPGSKWVTLTEGTPGTVDVSLVRPTHTLTVVTQPAGATISIAGRRAGTSPTVLKINGFTRVAITIEKPGYKPSVHKLYSKAAQDKLSVRLQRGR